ncbi:metal ABC transporter substrate-binding protein [Paraoerskovia marina]|uniref:Zinc transport system substrate-binding protein n=1 Tax=Paraoerskovia marina TaxID=545619 RepID=A0A1H1RZD6_9CELL|nr:metal ABC transporter substrate-binding protein [Paraoerskovia marina]SDS40339.1 zinc transport system substrate-binding protein [Paraoerskovia marina]
MPSARRTTLTIAAATSLALTLTACGAAADQTPENPDRVQVLASFYPLQYVAEEIGGDLVEVTNLTPPAAEPHDLELSPAQVRRVGDADLVVYLSDFQPAVDEAVEARDANALDAAESAHLESSPNGEAATDAAEQVDEADDDHSGETEEEHAEHADEAEATTESGSETEDEHDHGINDPHFWLDPTRLADVATAVEAELSAVDPENADEYSANLDELVGELTALDEDYSTALADCAGAALVTSHEAFGYLAERYDLVQVGLAGVDPQNEPSPARLREIRDVVEEYGVTTVFSETNASSKVAETFADDVGVDTAVLDPLETQNDDSLDYVDVMESNLQALEAGLVCS